MEELTWTEEEEESAEHPYYNNIPGKMPPPGGIIDTRLTSQNTAQDGCQVVFLTPGRVPKYFFLFLWLTVRLYVIRWAQDLSTRRITRGDTVLKTGEMTESPCSYNRVGNWLEPLQNRIGTAPCVQLFFSLSPAGSFDVISLPESKGQAQKVEMPAYVNTQQIDAQVLAALQAEGENVTKGLAPAAKESPQKDLFDMSERCV